MTTRLIITYVLNLFDLAVTSYWINKFGPGIEGNPIGQWLYETGLVYPVKIVGMAVLFVVLYKCIKADPRWGWTSWGVLAVYGVLALYHMTWIICISCK